MQDLQTFLDYAAIAPILITVGLFVEYCWRRSAATPAIPTQAIGVAQSEALHIPDPITLAEIALCDELIQVCKDTAASDAENYSDLLQIAPTPHPIEVPESALVPLGKLYSIPGSSKWGKTRRLRGSEREAVLAAIAC